MKPVTRSDPQWISVRDRNHVMLILQAYADNDKKKILTAAEKPKVIMDIIETCKLPQTSTYRKISSLIENGLLIPAGTLPMKYGKVVTKYTSLFENLEINIVKNEVSIRAKIGEDGLQALLRMMRNNIVNTSRDSDQKPKGYNNQRAGKEPDSIIPFVIKERIMKAKIK